MKVTDITLTLSADHWKEIPELENVVLFFSNDSDTITVPRIGEKIITSMRFRKYVEDKFKIEDNEIVIVYDVTYDYTDNTVSLHVKPYPW